VVNGFPLLNACIYRALEIKIVPQEPLKVVFGGCFCIRRVGGRCGWSVLVMVKIVGITNITVFTDYVFTNIYGLKISAV
jgi:hypothetical protein